MRDDIFSNYETRLMFKVALADKRLHTMAEDVRMSRKSYSEALTVMVVALSDAEYSMKRELPTKLISYTPESANYHEILLRMMFDGKSF